MHPKASNPPQHVGFLPSSLDLDTSLVILVLQITTLLSLFFFQQKEDMVVYSSYRREKSQNRGLFFVTLCMHVFQISLYMLVYILVYQYIIGGWSVLALASLLSFFVSLLRSLRSLPLSLSLSTQSLFILSASIYSLIKTLSLYSLTHSLTH